MTTRRTHWQTLAGVALLAASVAPWMIACGSDSAGTITTPTPVPSATATATTPTPTPTPASCADATKNGTETDVDCGGSCGKCTTAQGCASAGDCTSNVCTGTKCAAPNCVDATKNGTETDIDCGGSCTTKCAEGKVCAVAGDCGTNLCGSGHTCLPISCTDGIKTGSETDIDCGGTCSACADTKACSLPTDCTSNHCDPITKKCVAPTCSDAITNGSETDIDCGGMCSTKCANTKACSVGADCSSAHCDGVTKKCVAASCSDLIRNGSESDTDCGGSDCSKCGTNQTCGGPTDCASGVCNGTCAAPACNDVVQNGSETDIDCGGSCTSCAIGKACKVSADCAPAICDTLLCRLPKSCAELKTAVAASPDGTYLLDPDGAGGAAPLSVYCDMTTDGGGWTKILQYHDVAYTPTATASGDVTTSSTAAFAKLADASINAIGTAIGAGRAYRIQGPISPTGQKLFIFSAGTFDDTAVGMGIMSNALDVCETASFASCVKSTIPATYIDSLAWGLVGNDAERYFADYAGGSGVNCYNPGASGVRCFNAGVSTGHELIPDLTIWLK
jgi:hypothetical protein